MDIEIGTFVQLVPKGKERCDIYSESHINKVGKVIIIKGNPSDLINRVDYIVDFKLSGLTTQYASIRDLKIYKDHLSLKILI